MELRLRALNLNPEIKDHYFNPDYIYLLQNSKQRHCGFARATQGGATSSMHLGLHNAHGAEPKWHPTQLVWFSIEFVVT